MFFPRGKGFSAFPSIFFLLLIGVLVGACAKDGGGASSSSSTKQNPSTEPKSDPIVQLAFTVWKCEELECMDLETIETSTHTYTACAAMMEQAHEVGVQLCEERRGAAVSRPARCEPLGTQCPTKRSAYNWDSALREGGSALSDAGADASP
jgi:hypothetical protein